MLDNSSTKREEKGSRKDLKFGSAVQERLGGNSHTKHLYKGKEKILDLTCSAIEL